MHGTLLLEGHVSYNTRILKNLLKARQMLDVYRGFLWPFKTQLLKRAECYLFLEDCTNILIRHFLPFGLFGCK